MIRFIHAADLHLDRPFDGLTQLPGPIHRQARESTFTALTHLVDTALRERPDFMIIAGDIFDDSHRSIRAQRVFIREMERLSAAAIPVFLVYGNHDFLNREGGHLKLPESVSVFPDRPSMHALTCSGGQTVHLYGFSYHQRWMREDMVPQYQIKEPADYHIAILHGDASGSDESNYAPFSPHELAGYAFDYWALGHIHKRQQIAAAVPAWYPGDIQGLSFKESELGPKGALLVELDHGGAHVHFFPTAAVVWHHDVLDFSGEITAERLEKAVTARKEKLRSGPSAAFIRLDMNFEDQGADSRGTEELVKEIVASLNEEESGREDFAWIVSGSCRFRPAWDRELILNSPHFLGDLFRSIAEEGSVQEAVKPLYDHPVARRCLEPLNEAEQETIRRQSERLLAEVLIGTSSIEKNH